MDSANYRDADFVSEVAEDVLGVLRKSHFFRRLQDCYSAPQLSGAPLQCGHSFALSIQILRELCMDAEDIGDVLAVLRYRGASCDCEVLHKVAGLPQMNTHLFNLQAPDSLLQQQSASPYVN